MNPFLAGQDCRGAVATAVIDYEDILAVPADLGEDLLDVTLLVVDRDSGQKAHSLGRGRRGMGRLHLFRILWAAGAGSQRRSGASARASARGSNWRELSWRRHGGRHHRDADHHPPPRLPAPRPLAAGTAADLRRRLAAAARPALRLLPPHRLVLPADDRREGPAEGHAEPSDVRAPQRGEPLPARRHGPAHAPAGGRGAAAPAQPLPGARALVLLWV